MKKLKYVVLTFVLSFAFIIGAKAALSDDIAAAEANGADLNGLTGTISSEYSFALGQTSGMDAEYFGSTAIPDSVKTAWGTAWTSSFNSITTPMVLATDANKNKYGVRYKNVGIYNNQYVDVKATVVDYVAAATPTSTPVVALNGTSVDNYALGLKLMKIKYEFFKAGTDIPIVVKGNITYDLSNGKGVLIHDNNKQIFSNSGNSLKTATVDGKTVVFNGGESGNSPKGGLLMAGSGSSTLTSFTETFEGESITRTYQYGNLSDPNAGNEPSVMSTTPRAVVDVEIPGPSVGVNKSLVRMGEEFTFTITQTIPSVLPTNYYSSFSIDDTLADCLTVDTSKVVVKDEKGHNVTNKFDITNEGQKIIVNLKNGDDDSFYGHTYSIGITTSVKSGYDMSKYKVAGKYVIMNKANATKNGTVKCSEQVTLEYTTERITNVPKTFASMPFYVTVVGIMLLVVSLGTLYYMGMNKQEESGE